MTCINNTQLFVPSFVLNCFRRSLPKGVTVSSNTKITHEIRDSRSNKHTFTYETNGKGYYNLIWIGPDNVRYDLYIPIAGDTYSYSKGFIAAYEWSVYR